MRLLVVTQYFWPEDFRVNDLVRGMMERGHQVTVLTGLPNYPDGAVFESFRRNREKYSSYEGAEVLRVPLFPRGRGGFSLLLNYLSFPLTATVLGAWKLRGREFDAIFVFQGSPVSSALPALLFRRTKRAPLIMWVLDLWPESLSAVGAVRSQRILSAVAGLVRVIYRRCDRILVQSRAFYESVIRNGGSREQLAYFPNWVEPAFRNGLSGIATAPELEPFRGGFNVMFAGNIGEAQDMPAVLDAADRLRDLEDVRWLIVGDGRAVAGLRSEIQRRGLGDKVHLLGRYPVDRMPSFFAGADALLVSLRPEPIFALTVPGKVQSYLVAGKPVLGMIDGEGARVISESGGGIAVAAGDGAALALAVRRLAAMSPDDRSHMGEAGRAYALQTFDRERLFDQLVGWIEEARIRFRPALRVGGEEQERAR